LTTSWKIYNEADGDHKIINDTNERMKEKRKQE
jgi:hypothetical protein